MRRRFKFGAGLGCGSGELLRSDSGLESGRLRSVAGCLILTAAFTTNCRRGSRLRPAVATVGSVASNASAPSAPPSARAPSRAAAQFEGVLVATPTNPDAEVFPVGNRALVARGAEFAGSAAGAAALSSDVPSAGLPRGAALHLATVVGRWPKPVAALVGFFAGSGEPGNAHAFVLQGRVWRRIDHGKGLDLPRSAVMAKGALLAFFPPSFYLINGTLPIDPKTHQSYYPCTGKRPLHVRSFPLSDGAPAVPRVAASLFLMGLFTDGAGRPRLWGYDACRPGVWTGAIEHKLVHLVALPGSVRCAMRDPNNGLPTERAAFFPAADGGWYALVRSSVAKGARPCPERPRIVHFDVSGRWSSRTLDADPGSVELSKAYVDAAGTLWGPSRRGSVWRLGADGRPVEFGLAPSCAHPKGSDGAALDLEPDASIVRVVVPSPENPWIVVRYAAQNGVEGLCRVRGRGR